MYSVRIESVVNSRSDSGAGDRVAALVRPRGPLRKSLKSKLSRYESATKFYCYELPATRP